MGGRNEDGSERGPGPEPVREGSPVEGVWRALAEVSDPELERDIVDLGLVYAVEAEGGTVTVRMTLTSPGCPYGPYLMHQVRMAAERVPGVGSVEIDLVWEPPWGVERMSEEARLDLGFDV